MQEYMSNTVPTEAFRKVLAYLPSSKIESKEKDMWIAILPYMEESNLQRLANVLEKEFNYLMDIQLVSVQKQINPA